MRRSRSARGTGSRGAARRSARSGKRRGIGIANYVEFTTGAPREWTKVTVLPEGRVEVAIGTLSSGQGHQTSFAQLVTDWLGVRFDCVSLIQGDTDIIPVGGGSHSGRSMRLAGIVIGKASDAVIAKGKRIAAQVLEAAEHDIEFAGGRFTVQGTDRSIGIFEAAQRGACVGNDLPSELTRTARRRRRRDRYGRRMPVRQPCLRGRDRP